MSVQVYSCQHSLEGTAWSSILNITNSFFCLFIVSLYFYYLPFSVLAMKYEFACFPKLPLFNARILHEWRDSELTRGMTSSWLLPDSVYTPLSALMSSHDFKSHSNTANWRTPTSSTDLVFSYRQTYNYCLHSDASTSQTWCGKEECSFFTLNVL